MELPAPCLTDTVLATYLFAVIDRAVITETARLARQFIPSRL